MPHEPPTPTDEELVRTVLAGDRERFGELVERYQGRLVNYLHRLVRNLDEAHDLAQEVFVRVYQALDRFDPQYRFSTWLFRVAQNAAIDVIRKRRFRLVPLSRPEEDGGEGTWELDLPAEGPGALETLETRERDAGIRVAIDALPWEYRELILLRHYGELAYEEIAQAKGMPLGTVKNKLFRARQMLKGVLTRGEPERGEPGA
jgi:RNA polymerase sigma-70 factor (ECF subfamily)